MVCATRGAGRSRLRRWISACALAAGLAAAPAAAAETNYGLFAPPPAPAATSWAAPAGLPSVVPAAYAEPAPLQLVSCHETAPYYDHGPACTTHTVAAACCDDRRWYVSLSGGWQHRENVYEASDNSTFIFFQDGFAVNAALGYQFDCFRVEAEYSFMNNEASEAGSGGLASPTYGNVNLRALMFNVYHDFEIGNWAWKPYVGAGIGLYQSELNGLIPDFFSDPAVNPPNVNQSFGQNPINATSNTPFAYQFRVGASRPLGHRTDLTVGYRYFKGGQLEFAAAPFAQFAPTFNPNAAAIHSLEFGLRVRF